MKYAGLTMQIMVALALAVFAGIKLDEWFEFSTPLLVWLLPLLIVVVMMWQVIKDTSKQK
ncbi:AtpZ/AtpI family protein [Aridibaculum aurantiacum]|uniref:AtpZ/AtpI family protein n=1 Tax=Aridibaculum aurantiacum TaxID=2810307 RepID=UPI001A97B896|nr:AtpZ/AtpI family protein [Aridibaculum aurantiacum]